MSNKEQMKALCKRDKWFHILYFTVMVIGVILTIISAINEYKGIETFYSFTDPTWILVVVLLGALIRWIYYESASYKLSNATLPVSKKNLMKYDLIIGDWSIIFLTILYGGIALWGDTVLWHPYVVDLELFISVYFVDVMTIIFTFMMLHAICIIGKHISTNVGWGIYFSVVGCILAVSGMEEVDYLIVNSNLFGLKEEYLYGFKEEYPYLAYEMIFLLVYLLVVILLHWLAFRLVEKKDEAKHGAYYFKWAQIFVCAVTPLLTFYIAFEYVREGVNPTLVYIRNGILAIVCVGIFVGLYYITRPRKRV